MRQRREVWLACGLLVLTCAGIVVLWAKRPRPVDLPVEPERTQWAERPHEESGLVLSMLELDEDGRVLREVKGGHFFEYGYDAEHRLRSITVEGWHTRLDYDDHGRVSRVEDASGSTSFGYDAFDRLIEARVVHSPPVVVQYVIERVLQLRQFAAFAGQLPFEVFAPFLGVRLG